MISPALCPTLTLLLIIGTLFTVSLTENLQLADGFTASGARIIFDVQLGETAVHEWALQNVIDETIGIEVYVTGEGSELLTFEKLHILEPGEIVLPEIIVSIPKDHPDNIAYKVSLFALKRAPTLDHTSGAAIAVNSQLKSFIEINIGDNPIYTPPQLPPSTQLPPPPIIKTVPEVEEGEDPAPIIEETLQEKLARINAANQQILTAETIETEMEEIETDVEPGYIPEPVMDKEPEAQEECGFWEMILSWFGIKSDCI